MEKPFANFIALQGGAVEVARVVSITIPYNLKLTIPVPVQKLDYR
jgi:hypothetical protein